MKKLTKTEKAVIILPVLLVLAAGGYKIYREIPAVGRTSKTIGWAQEAVAAKLLDGESAKFRNIRMLGDSITCGEVNGKNVYGAYTGFKDFYVLGRPEKSLAEGDVRIENDDPIWRKLIKKICTNV